jgi:uncharacterized protein
VKYLGHQEIGNISWPVWEQKFLHFLETETETDAAHDAAHVKRVVTNARQLAVEEKANLAVVLPASWLHDCVTVPKNSAERPQASRLAAQKAGQFLLESGYPAEYIPDIEHAIAAHSFSAQIKPESVEAKVVQDADRLDAIGAIGIARCFAVGGTLQTRLYDPADPFAAARPFDDRANIVDHFYVKLLRLMDSMTTNAGREEAQRRTAFMVQYLDQLRREIGA